MSRRGYKLSDETYEYIKGEVAHLFKKYNIKCVPVSGFELASKMGITMIPYSSLSKEKLSAAMRASSDGFYEEVCGNECIYYNNIDISYERQNMTILHEIGHCVLDHIEHGLHEETEANFFAKYAIAPPVLVHKTKSFSAYDIYITFDISYEAATYAYEYYTKWVMAYSSRRRLLEYEKIILIQYEKTA